MVRAYKNIPSLHKFIESAPLEAILRLFVGSGLGDEPWITSVDLSAIANDDAAQCNIRRTLMRACVDLNPTKCVELDGYARRIVALSEGTGVEAIRIARNNLHRCDDQQQSIAQDFDTQMDDYGRATVLFICTPLLFDDAERFLYAEHYRNNGKEYEAYDLDCQDIDSFIWNTEKASALEAKLGERLNIAGSCLIQYFPFEQNNTGNGARVVHLFLIRHAGPMNSVRDVESDLSTKPVYFRPPVEATLIFQPEYKQVEVFAKEETARFLIASSFAEVGVNTDLSGRPVSLRQYNLMRFYHSLALPQGPCAELGLIDVRVVEAEARPWNLKRRVILKVGKDDDIDEAVGEELGDNNVFRRATLISRIILNVRFMRDGKEINLSVTLSSPNRCNLGSRRDPREREIGFAVLEHYNLMRRVKLLGEDEEATIFTALLGLYESDRKEVRRSQLEQWGADIEMMRTGGFLVPKGRAPDVTRIRDDGRSVNLTDLPLLVWPHINKYIFKSMHCDNLTAWSVPM
ncbi:hypothetical protein CCP4SC76_4410001 [Gammaproteobacteria bacterium]